MQVHAFIIVLLRGFCRSVHDAFDALARQVFENTVSATNMVAESVTEGSSKIVEAGKSITTEIVDGTESVSRQCFPDT